MSSTAETDAGGLSPQRLTLEQAARLLTKVSGQPVTLAMLQQDITAGAPTNADGTLNLLHFAAWIVKEMSNDDV